MRWLIVRGPCSLSLRTALETAWRANGTILLTKPGRPLMRPTHRRDRRDPVDAAVARIDAGLLLAHLKRLSAFRRLARLLQSDPTPSPTTTYPTSPPPTYQPAPTLTYQPPQAPLQHPSPNAPIPPSRT